ncbi:hypothetical protein BDW69DRAFT_162764 [Aspergillus filifer]
MIHAKFDGLDLMEKFFRHWWRFSSASGISIVPGTLMAEDTVDAGHANHDESNLKVNRRTTEKAANHLSRTGGEIPWLKLASYPSPSCVAFTHASMPCMYPNPPVVPPTIQARSSQSSPPSPKRTDATRRTKTRPEANNRVHGVNLKLVCQALSRWPESKPSDFV